MKVNKKIVTSIVLMVILLLSVACAKDIEVAVTETVIVPQDEEFPKVKIEMVDGGSMIFELYPQYAPETVDNFLGLVETGFYDGLKFHRIIKGFMAQSGDPEGNGSGGAENTIKGEFSNNGFDQNTLKHTKGILSMARSNDPDSASSQFFIMDGASPNLDGSYAAFGKLIEGEEVLDKITATEVEKNLYGELSSPISEVLIKSITIYLN